MLGLLWMQVVRACDYSCMVCQGLWQRGQCLLELRAVVLQELWRVVGSWTNVGERGQQGIGVCGMLVVEIAAGLA